MRICLKVAWRKNHYKMGKFSGCLVEIAELLKTPLVISLINKRLVKFSDFIDPQIRINFCFSMPKRKLAFAFA
jgi:hypothetical protein